MSEEKKTIEDNKKDSNEKESVKNEVETKKELSPEEYFMIVLVKEHLWKNSRKYH